MKRLWVASLLVLCFACTGANRPDPHALSNAEQALGEGDLEQARMWAENAYNGAPDDPSTRQTMAAVHRALAERAEGEGELSRASDAFVRAAEKEPFRRQRASDYYRAFENARSAGRDTALAAPLLLRSLDADPSDIEVRRAAADTFDELGQPNVAIEHYLFVWEADRSAVPVGLRLGTLYASTGKVGDAEAVFGRVLAQDPENVQAKLSLADVYEAVQQNGRAKSMYEALRKEHAGNPSILFRYADFLDRQNEGDRAEMMREEARGELPGVKRRKMRTLKSRKKKKRKR